MALISYILFVAMLNVCLGFGVAVYLGRRYNELLADDEPWQSMPFGESLEPTAPEPAAEPEPGDTQITDTAKTDVAEPEQQETSQPSPPEPVVAETTETDEAPPDTTDPDEVATEPTETDETAPEPEAAPPAPAATDAADIAETSVAGIGTSDDDTTEGVTVEPETTELETPSSAPPAAPPADETAGPEASPEPAHQKGSAAVAATDLKVNVAEFQTQLAELCEQLRGHAEDPEASKVETCLDSLSAATEEYLENSKCPQAALDQLRREPELKQVGQQVQDAIQRHDEQAENLNATVVSLDRQGDLAEGCRNIAEKSDELLSCGHQLRDKLDEAAAKITEGEAAADQTDPAARTDPQTGLTNRAGLEAYLAQWWEDDPERTRLLSVAAIDVDEFAAINAQIGHKAGGQMLCAVGKLLQTEVDAGVVVTRFSGQRFLLLYPDGDARTATNGVEKVRQMIAKTRFLHRDSESCLTVSCAVTIASPDDTSASLIARVETALQEAKRYGRNRTFLHEGEYPEPVVPPQFTFGERRITL